MASLFDTVTCDFLRLSHDHLFMELSVHAASESHKADDAPMLAPATAAFHRETPYAQTATLHQFMQAIPTLTSAPNSTCRFP